MNICSKTARFIRSDFPRHVSKRLCSTMDPLEPPAERSKARKRTLLEGPALKDFFKSEHLRKVEDVDKADLVPYLKRSVSGRGRRVFFDVYGCQMNVNDTEIIWAILKAAGFAKTERLHEADVVLIVTCAIREGAEQKVWNRLDYIKSVQKRKRRGAMKIGLLGCMAERLKQRVLEFDKSVDLVAGPDSYKDLPRLLALAEDNQTAINVMLSLDETYADVMPIRMNENSVSAYVSIMRGCDNMCTYCVVPFTRGRERSRPVGSIVDEVRYLRDAGVKEITLLGQNVNSYRDLSQGINRGEVTHMANGFRTVYKAKQSGLRFADLLHQVAEVDGEIRVRFTSPHPKDFPDEVLQAIKAHPNICKSIHLPAQSGNSDVLERMRRGYTREAYLELVQHIRDVLPSVAFSSDFICGFCGETDDEFQDTITLMRKVRYNSAYLFAYSMREKTAAHRRFIDDVPKRTKLERLRQMIQAHRSDATILHESQIGKAHLVLVEGASKRSGSFLAGRNDQNIKVIIPAGELADEHDENLRAIQVGDYVAVQINAANSQVLKGIPLYRTSLTSYYNSLASVYNREEYLHVTGLSGV